MPKSTLESYPTPIAAQIITALINDVLRSDPTIQELGIEVRAPEGDSLDWVERTPDESDMPMIRLSPLYSDVSTWGFEDAHRVNLSLPFELFVVGTHYEDREKLSDIFRNAIFPQPWTSDRRAVVERQFHQNPNLGIERVTIASGGAQSRHLGADRYASVVTATVLVVYTVET